MSDLFVRFATGRNSRDHLSMVPKRLLGGSLGPVPPLPDKKTGGALLWWLYRNQMGRFVLASTIAIAWMATLAATPVALGQAIDAGIREESTSDLLLWIGVILALGVAASVLWIARHQCTTGNGRRTLRWLEGAMAQRLLDDRGGTDTTTTPGEVVSLVSSDTQRIARVIEASARGMGAIFTFIGVVAAMFLLSPLLATTVLVSLVPFFIAITVTIRRLERRSHAQQQALGRTSSVAADAISGLRVVRGIGGTNEMIRRYRHESNITAARGVEAVRLQALSAALAVAMPGAVIAVIGWLGGRLAVDDSLSAGQLVTFAAWAVWLLTPLLTFDELARRFALAHAAATRIGALLALPGAVEAHPTPSEIDVRDGAPAIELRDVDLSFGDSTVGHRLSFEVRADEFTAIAAGHLASGAVASILARTSDPSGTVVVDGRNIVETPVAELRSNLLVAENDAVLFEGSLRLNLQVGDPNAGDDEMLDAMEVAAAGDILSGLDEGLDGIVSERGRSLSGGQRQRVGLARALLTKPEILVLIDPTSAVDAYTESEIVDRLYKARDGMTTVVITSSPALLGRADRVLMLNRSSVESGTHEELLDASATYRELLGYDEPETVPAS